MTTDEDIVAALAEVLNEAGIRSCEEFDPNDPDSGCPDCGDVMDAAAALLPTVRHIAEQRAAEELEAASAAYWRDVTFPIARYPEVRDWLRDRAAALTATPNHGTDTTT